MKIENKIAIKNDLIYHGMTENEYKIVLACFQHWRSQYPHETVSVNECGIDENCNYSICFTLNTSLDFPDEKTNQTFFAAITASMESLKNYIREHTGIVPVQARS